VCDYKFSKDPKRYGVTDPKDFLQDPQALLYAAYSFVKYGTSRVFLRWLKFKTEGRPAIHPVDAILTRQQVNEAFGRVVHPTAQALVRIRTRKSDPNTYPPNFDACHDFNRPCPYGAYCKGSAMSLLDEMRALVQAPEEAPATNGVKAPDPINPPALAKAPAPVATTRTWTPEPLARVLLEELGAAMTRAAARV
jgi:hypothetical protein